MSILGFSYKNEKILFSFFLILLFDVFSCFEWSDLNLPPSLIPFYVNLNSAVKKHCRKDNLCPYKEFLNGNKCFGYEKGCDLNKGYSRKHIKCNGKSRWPTAHTLAEQETLFWNQADFGYLKERKENLVDICTSDTKDGSYISCSDQLRYCYVKNIFFHLKSFNAPSSRRYRDDVIHDGEVGGKCDIFNKELLKSRANHKSYLQSWAHELLPFNSYDNFTVNKKHCDIIFNRPTVIIKLDAAVNMYHHFCDFLNLYASQHINGSFDMDIDIVWWDTHPSGFGDSMFGVTWKAFSNRIPIELISLDGKKVCFREAMLPLLARMQFGMYYNMPLVDGCSGSGLFHTFSKHLLHRLKVKQEGPIKDKIRVTLLSRSTKFRRINNEQEIINALKTISEFEVRKVDYNSRVPFIDQLKSTYNSDIFIGMHGSGLTHCLFLPDWGAIFEIHHCDDKNCYQDLARLRGVHYRQWENENKVKEEFEGKHPTLGTPHRKFTNYEFDIPEVMRIVLEMAENVKKHPQFIQEQEKLKRQTHEEL